MTVDLKKFNMNSKYPVAARANTVSGSCTLNSQSVGAYATVSSTTYITVGSGDICNTTLLVDGEYIADARQYATGNQDGLLYQVVVERRSATQVALMVAATNYSASAVTCSSKTATAYINAFNVP